MEHKLDSFLRDITQSQVTENYGFFTDFISCLLLLLSLRLLLLDVASFKFLFLFHLLLHHVC